MTHPTPNAAEACALFDGLRLAHECDTLAQVELCLIFAVHAIDLNQRGVIILICFPPAHL